MEAPVTHASAPSNATSGQIEPRRLARAVWLDAVRLGPGQFQVTGGSEPHEVQLSGVEGRQCDCPDYLWRHQICKHMLIALLHEGSPDVIEALRLVVQAPGSLAGGE